MRTHTDSQVLRAVLGQVGAAGGQVLGQTEGGRQVLRAVCGQAEAGQQVLGEVLGQAETGALIIQLFI